MLELLPDAPDLPVAVAMVVSTNDDLVAASAAVSRGEDSVSRDEGAAAEVPVRVEKS